jgi:hypothetical protein
MAEKYVPNRMLKYKIGVLSGISVAAKNAVRTMTTSMLIGMLNPASKMRKKTINGA